MVDVCVRQHDSIDRGGSDGERGPVAQAQGFQALKESAVHEDTGVRRIQEKAASSDRSRRSEELHAGKGWPDYFHASAWATRAAVRIAFVG